MKEDEAWLLKEIYSEYKKKPIEQPIGITFNFFKPLGYKTPREIIQGQDKYNHKRLWYVLEKFCSKGWIDYGTSLGSAWITAEGMEVARSL